MSNELKRQPGGHFAKGQSGNPAGRHAPSAMTLVKALRKQIPPDYIAEFIRRVADGEPWYQNVEWYRENVRRRARGEDPLPPPDEGVPVFPTMAERIAAVRFAAEWTEPKPTVKTEVAVTAGPADDFSQFTDEELETYLSLKDKMRRRVDSQSATRVLLDSESRALAVGAIAAHSATVVSRESDEDGDR